jgi:hypothetical protein
LRTSRVIVADADDLHAVGGADRAGHSSSTNISTTPNWEQHEFRAFQEFVTERVVKYRYLGFSRQQMAMRIEALSARSA